jgi:hypothetical protein
MPAVLSVSDPFPLLLRPPRVPTVQQDSRARESLAATVVNYSGTVFHLCPLNLDLGQISCLLGEGEDVYC